MYYLTEQRNFPLHRKELIGQMEKIATTLLLIIFSKTKQNKNKLNTHTHTHTHTHTQKGLPKGSSKVNWNLNKGVAYIAHFLLF